MSGLESSFTNVFERAKSGDPMAFEELLEHAADHLHYYCDVRLGRKLREQYDPFDVTQETYIQALRSIADLEAADWKGFMRWLYRVAENRIRTLSDHVSAQKRTPPGRRVTDSHALDRLKARLTGPLTAAAREERKQSLRDALDQLPDDQRIAVTLYYFHQAPVVDIAEALSKPETTARRILDRGLRALGSCLRDATGK